MSFLKEISKYNKLTNFTYNEKTIEFTKSYKYLGVEFQQNGKYKDVINTRILKARNAIYAINRACATDNTSSTHTKRKLFESKIFPILTYGSAIWGQMTNNRLQFKQNHDIIKESIRTKIKKLGVHIQDIRTNRTNKSLGSFKCSTYEDKLQLLQNDQLRTNSCLKSPPFDNYHTKIETFLNVSIKKLLGIKKCANNSIARMHIGWKPISITIWMAILLATHIRTNQQPST